MPFTPYHFGPSGFLGLVFRKWIDIPVFVLANVVVDVEVLVIMIFGLGRPGHRYCHTLLIGAVVGAVWGIAAYRIKAIFKWTMRLVRIPYEPKLIKMIISGVLGAWLHVVIDAIYHWDVHIFWPGKARPLWRLLSKGQVEWVCIILFFAALIPYAFALWAFMKDKRSRGKA